VPPVDTELGSDPPPERVRGAPADVVCERPQLLPGVAHGLDEVDRVGRTSAHVREGTKLPLLSSFWANELYDWSWPSPVRWTVGGNARLAVVHEAAQGDPDQGGAKEAE
jgi:hypothetical protein